MRKTVFLISTLLLSIAVLHRTHDLTRAIAQSATNAVINPNAYQDLRWRNIGPTRGGRSTAAAVNPPPPPARSCSRRTAAGSTSVRSPISRRARPAW